MSFWRSQIFMGIAGRTLLLAGIRLRPRRAGSGGRGSTAPRIVPVTVAPLEHRAVERTVEVIGTLRGWEQVTLGSKRSGRVVKVYHDIGDRVQPGEPLVELDPVDARLGVQQAESKYLGELVKLGITKQQAEDFVKKYGISEELLIGQVADDAIAKSPAVVQKHVAREKAQQHLTRQRALTQRGAGTPQELEDAETDWRTAAASYDDAVQVARTVIANAIASKVALSQAEQTLKDMIIRAPMPKLLPPSLTRTSPLSYGITRRQVSEGQMIKEGEAVAELVIEDPIRLWSQVPEQYSEDVRVGQRGAALDTCPPGRVDRRQGRAHQPLGRLVEPHVSGRDAGAQRTRPAPARRLRQGFDHHRRRSAGQPSFPSIRSSGSPASPSSSSSRTARHDRSTTSRPAAKGAAGSRSRASSSPIPRPSSPRDRPNSPTERPSSSASPSRPLRPKPREDTRLPETAARQPPSPSRASAGVTSRSVAA